MSDHQSFRENGEPDYGRTGFGRGPGQDRSSTPDWYPTPGPWEDKDELDAQQQVDQRYGQSPLAGNPGNGPSYGQDGYGPGYGTGALPGYGPQGYASPGQPTSGYPQTGYGPHGYGQAGYGGYGAMPAVRSPQQVEADKAARLSMILAIVGLVFPIASIFLGPIAIGQSNKAQRLGGNATIGKVLGWVATALGVFWILGTVTSVVFGGLAALFGF